MRIGLFGGSFNPVHNGHVTMAICAREQLELERLLVVPARQSPHKRQRPEIDDATRLALVTAAFTGVPAIEVVRWELDRTGLSYTVDTVKQAAATFAGAEIHIVMGADSFVDFPKWFDVPGIVSRAAVAVVLRPGLDHAAMAARASTIDGLRWRTLEVPLNATSSTHVRERARAGLPLHGLVPDDVRRIIERDGLYDSR